MNNKAFTIVEISLALVIIGLISFGISSASSMFESAKIKSMIHDMADVDMAYTNFRGRYNSIPGDMSYAEAYWSDCAETNSNCNGNGNGVIEVGNTAQNDEIVKAWRHLSLSGFFSFTPEIIPDTHNGTITPGLNAPPSSFDNVGYFIGGGRLITSSSNAQSPFLDAVNSVYAGCVAPGADHDPLVGGGLTPEITFLIDQKLDDGTTNELGEWTGAATGKIRAIDGTMFSAGDCYSGNTYNNSMSSPACVAARAINYFTNSSDTYTEVAEMARGMAPEEEPEVDEKAAAAEESGFPAWMPQWMIDLFIAEGGWPEWIPEWMVEMIENDGEGEIPK